MMKITALLSLFCLIFLSSVRGVSAQLISVNKNGEAVWNVLSFESVNLETPRRTLEIKDAAKITPTTDSQISLSKDNNKISLLVESEEQQKQLDVTGWKDKLIEIEERPEMQRILIGVDDGKFTVKEKGVTAATDFPLMVDSKTAKISVTTDTGDRYIAVFPYQAVESALRAKVVNTVAYNEKLVLTEEDSELLYVITGTKDLTFFNFYTHSFPVKSKVSALNGSILATDEPVWLKILGFLFV